jgi:hypothetical protein
VGYLQEVDLPYDNTVVELTNEATGELVYSHRVAGMSFAAPIFSKDKYTLKIGKTRGDVVILNGAVGN